MIGTLLALATTLAGIGLLALAVWTERADAQLAEREARSHE